MKERETEELKKKWQKPEIEMLSVAETAQDNGNPLDPPDFPEAS